MLPTTCTGCENVFYEAIKESQSGTVSVVSQDTIEMVGVYCGMRGPEDEIFDRDSSSREVFNFVRAICCIGPMAASILNGQEIKINGAR